MKRNKVDLSHNLFVPGRIGGLQTLAMIPVVAGDSMELDLQGLFRLSPLRRALTVDAKVDVFTFFVKHRHVYDDWEQFLEDGEDESVTFPTVTPALNTNYTGCFYPLGVAAPLWPFAGYGKIFNRYFVVPSDTAGKLSETAALSGSEDSQSGAQCGYLPTIWSTGLNDTVVDADHQITLAGGVLDLQDLAQIKGTYKSELKRSWFARRYNDVMQEVYGTSVNSDADERPTVCSRSSFWLSGHDIDGTGDANLGEFSGKGATIGRHHMRRKWFSEHGTLFVMALVRFPSIHEKECHALTRLAQPTYAQISGDPDIISRKAPEAMTTADFFIDGSSTALGTMPYGQHYRYQPSYVHEQYSAISGFSFLNNTPTSTTAARYIGIDEYDDTFQSQQLFHYQVNASVRCGASRVTSDAKTSIFAGVR